MIILWTVLCLVTKYTIYLYLLESIKLVQPTMFNDLSVPNPGKWPSMYLCAKLLIFTRSTILLLEFGNCSDSIIFFWLSFNYFTRENYSILYNPTTGKSPLSVINYSSQGTKKWSMSVSTILIKWLLPPPHKLS